MTAPCLSREETKNQEFKICPICNKHFTKPKAYGQVHWKRRITCSRTCRNRKKIPNHDDVQGWLSLLFSKIIVSQTGCWEYQGYIHPRTGYGMANVRGRGGHVHRHIYTLMFGPMEKDMFVCHKCDNRKCINPSHLFPGTNQDNMIDMAKKNRGMPQGKRQVAHEKMPEILSMIRRGILYADIGKRFGVGLSRISQIAINHGIRRLKCR